VARKRSTAERRRPTELMTPSLLAAQPAAGLVKTWSTPK
jgi:hypothetical protein